MGFVSIKRAVLAGTIAVSFAIVGCGGGGSPTSNVSESEKAPLNEKSTSALGSSLNELSQSFGDLRINENILSANAQGGLLKRAAKSMSRVAKSKMDAADTNIETCQEGGSISIGSTDSSVSAVFNHCKEYGILYNGSVDIGINSNQTEFSFSMRAFTLTTDEGDKVTIDSLDATVKASAGIDADEIDSMTIAVNGSISTSIDSIAFKIRKIEVTSNSLYFDGDIKTACLGGWITVETTEKFQYVSDSVGDDVFTTGTLKISGQGGSAITIEAMADGSIKLTDPNGTQTSYASYDLFVEQFMTNGDGCIVP